MTRHRSKLQALLSAASGINDEWLHQHSWHLMIFSLHQRSLINFAQLPPSGPNGNKGFSNSIGSKLGDCTAKTSHMRLNPWSPDRGTDKNPTPGGSMQNVLTCYVVASYWAQYVLLLERYGGGNIADVLLLGIFTLCTRCGSQFCDLWPEGGVGNRTDCTTTLLHPQNLNVNRHKTEQSPQTETHTETFCISFASPHVLHFYYLSM